MSRSTKAPGSLPADVAALFDAQRRRLWGLVYRLTGSAADADDVVQETFVRLIERRPRGEPGALAAWLTRVATNLGVDALRRRRRRRYPGPWLPEPIQACEADWLDAAAHPAADPEARYDRLQSITYAFLLALEALGPRQRAALLLRDVAGYSASEAAAVLDTTAGNLRVLHLRARRALAAYDRAACVPGPELRARHRAVLRRLVDCLLAEDAGTLESLLAESVRTTTDAGGRYTALAAPLRGRVPVARLYLRAAAMRRPARPVYELRDVNGLPALVIQLADPQRRQAPRSVLCCELDDDGRIRELHAILAPGKLAAIPVSPGRP